MALDVRSVSGGPAGRLEVSKAGLMTVFDYSFDRDPGPSRLELQAGELIFNVGVPLPFAGGLRLTRKFSRNALGDFDPSSPFTAWLVPVGESLPSNIGMSEDNPLSPESSGSPGGDEVADTAGPDDKDGGGSESAVAASAEDATEDTADNAQPAAPTGGDAPETAREDVWLSEPDPARHLEDPALQAAAAQCAGVLAKSDGEDTLLAFPWAPSKPFPMLPAFRLGTAQDIDGGHYMVFRVRNGRPV